MSSPSFVSLLSVRVTNRIEPLDPISAAIACRAKTLCPIVGKRGTEVRGWSFPRASFPSVPTPAKK